MNRPVLILSVTLVSVFAAVTAWKASRKAERVEEGVALSEGRRAEVRRFWEVYGRATDLKQRGAWAEDTKKKAPILSEGASRKSLFGPFCAALRGWQEGEVSAGRMEGEYRKLDAVLKNLSR